jgi:hypothetical protein
MASRVMPEARESLLKLTPADTVEKLLQTAKGELKSYNNFEFGRLVPNLKTNIESEFYLVFAPDGTRPGQVAEVRFIKGADELKPFAAQLKTAKYGLVFPDSAPTKIVRRGTLWCVAASGVCTFTLVSPDSITSVD